MIEEVMRAARDAWWGDLSKRGDPLYLTNVSKAFAAGFKAAKEYQCSEANLVPDSAEWLSNAGQWLKEVEVQSVLVTGAVQKQTQLTCPVCSDVHGNVKAYRTMRCRCGALLQTCGTTSLLIWRDPPKPKEPAKEPAASAA